MSWGIIGLTLLALLLGGSAVNENIQRKHCEKRIQQIESNDYTRPAYGGCNCNDDGLQIQPLLQDDHVGVPDSLQKRTEQGNEFSQSRTTGVESNHIRHDIPNNPPSGAETFER